MSQENMEDQLKVLQNHIGGFARLCKDLLSRVKALEEKQGEIKGENKKELKETKQVIDMTMEANADAVKKLDREIKGILKDKGKMEASRKEVEDTLKKMDKEITMIKLGLKNGESNEKIKTGDDDKRITKYRY